MFIKMHTLQKHFKGESPPWSTPGRDTHTHTRVKQRSQEFNAGHNILYLAFAQTGVPCTTFHVISHKPTSFFLMTTYGSLL